jgi:hypothetical protein
MALEKEEQEAKMEVRKKKRKNAHGTKDEPYFAHKHLSSARLRLQANMLLRARLWTNSRQLPGVGALHPF